ncbi:MAG: DNA recombination protein RmuC, partial [Actinomycetota bacterium]
MDLPTLIIALAAGLCLGLAAAFILRLGRAKTARELAGELIRDSEARRQAELDAVLESVRASFGDLSLKALSRSSEELVKLAQATLATEREAGAKELGEKKSLIDQQLKEMTTRMENVSTLVKELEKDRQHKFGELSQHLRSAHEQTAALAQTTNSLREALASTKARGQWGERMAEDVLRMAGLIENV